MATKQEKTQVQRALNKALERLEFALGISDSVLDAGERSIILESITRILRVESRVYGDLS